MNASLAIGADGTIYGLGTLGTGTVAYAVGSDGIEKWRTSLNGVGAQDQGGVVIGIDGTVIVTVKRASGEATGGIVALDAQNGAIKWHYGIAEDVSGCAAVDQVGNIHFATQSGNYYIIKSDASEDPLILKRDLASLIAESTSSLGAGWEAGMAKVWSSPVIGMDGTIYVGVTNTNNTSQSVLIALEDEGVTGPASSAWPMKGGNAQHTSLQK